MVAELRELQDELNRAATRNDEMEKKIEGLTLKVTQLNTLLEGTLRGTQLKDKIEEIEDRLADQEARTARIDKVEDSLRHMEELKGVLGDMLNRGFADLNNKVAGAEAAYVKQQEELKTLYEGASIEFATVRSEM